MRKTKNLNLGCMQYTSHCAGHISRSYSAACFSDRTCVSLGKAHFRNGLKSHTHTQKKPKTRKNGTSTGSAYIHGTFKYISHINPFIVVVFGCCCCGCVLILFLVCIVAFLFLGVFWTHFSLRYWCHSHRKTMNEGIKQRQEMYKYEISNVAQRGFSSRFFSLLFVSSFSCNS